MSQKVRASGNASKCAAFSEYLKNSTVDLGRLLATKRTLLASWALAAAFTVAMLLIPAVIHDVQYAEAHARHAVQMVHSHKVSLGRGLCALIAAHTSKAC